MYMFNPYLSIYLSIYLFLHSSSELPNLHSLSQPHRTASTGLTPGASSARRAPCGSLPASGVCVECRESTTLYWGYPKNGWFIMVNND